MPPSPTERTSEGRLDGAIDGKMLHAHHVRDRVMLSQDITGALFASWIELRTGRKGCIHMGWLLFPVLFEIGFEGLGQ